MGWRGVAGSSSRLRTGIRLLVGLMAGLTPRALYHVISDDHEDGAELPVQLGAHLAKDLLPLGLVEVGREGPDGLNEVISLNATVGRVRLRRCQLEQRPGFVAEGLDLGAGIRSEISFAVDS